MPGPERGGLLRRVLLFCLALLSPQISVAAQVVVVGGDGPYHRDVFTAMRQVLAGQRIDHQLVYRTLEQYQAERGLQPVLLVAIGTAAAHALAPAPRAVPLLGVLLPRGELGTLSQHAVVGGLSELYIDQPLRRYLLLARLALPERRHVGAVLGPVSAVMADELDAEGRRLNMDVQTTAIAEGRELTAAMAQVTRPSGLLLALPDPAVVNADTARTLILDAYHRNVALIGYSQALAKAGALMSVYSTPEQIGKEAGEMVLAALSTTPVHLPSPRHPSYFSVSVNYPVARALGLNLPSEEQLVRELRRQEGVR